MRVVIQTVVLGFFVMASLGLAENDNHQSVTKPAEESVVKRPEGKWDIGRYEGFLSEVFERPKAALNRHYGATLPVALQKVVKEKDESEIAAIVADLLSHRSNEQKAKVVKMAQQVRDIKEKEDTTDAQAIAFLDRLIWGGKGALGQKVDKTEKNEKFMLAFLGDPTNKKDIGAFRDTLKKQEGLGLAAKKLADPNATQADKKWARDKALGQDGFTRDEAMAWVGSQMKGNKAQALAIANLFAKTDPSGEKYFDVFNGNQAERLYAGPNQQSMESALKAYAANRGNMHNVTVAESEHTNVAPVELVARGGKLLANKRPQGVRPPAAAAVAGGGGAPRPPGVAPVRPNPNRNQVASVNSDGAALYAARCTTCHPSKGNATQEIDAIQSGRMPDLKDPSKPGAKPLTEDEKKAIIAHLSTT